VKGQDPVNVVLDMWLKGEGIDDLALKVVPIEGKVMVK
jgi:hypothetical protein